MVAAGLAAAAVGNATSASSHWLAEHLVHELGATSTTLVLVSLLLVIFYVLAKVCDEAIAPCLEFASEYFAIPRDVSCATMLAMGSSAPEIVISCVSIAAEEENVSLGTLFGSAIIAFTIIPAGCVLVSPGMFLHLRVVPLLRDAGFYCTGMLVFVVSAVVGNGVVYWYECFAMVLLFMVYIASMRPLAKLYASSADKEEEEEQEAMCQQVEEGVLSTPPMESSSSSLCQFVLPPYHRWYSTTTTDLIIQQHWGKLLVVGIAYVAVFAEACVFVTNALSATWAVSANVLAVLLVALGAQIPDLVASLAVARKGEGPGAIANAIGSQVLSVLLGLGLPFLLSCLVQGRGVPVNFAHTFKLGGGLLVAITSLVGLALRRPVMKLGECGLDKRDAIILVCIYLLLVVSEAVVQ